MRNDNIMGKKKCRNSWSSEDLSGLTCVELCGWMKLKFNYHTKEIHEKSHIPMICLTMTAVVGNRK